MQPWITTIITFLLQESASLAAMLLYLYQSGENLWIIHGLFVSATIVDIFVGFAVGKYLHTHLLEGSRFERWVRKQARFLREPGWQYLLTLAGIVNYPYLNAVLGSWLDLPFWTVFWATLIGDLASYGLFWAITFGVIKLSINIYLGTAITAGIVIATMILLKKYFFKNSEGPI